MPIRRSRARVVIPILVAASALLLASCGTDLPGNTLDAQGDHAQRILDLLIPIAWAGLAVFIIVEGILLYTVFRFRAKPNAAIPAQIHGNLRVEILWTIIPALIVLVISVLTFNTQAQNAEPILNPAADTLYIKGVGHQWYFEFQYPDQQIVTGTDLYIPTGRQVVMELTGRDVIHNFWVPKLAGKTDMIPSHTNRLAFRTENPGIYRGQCAEFCGTDHALMGFNVIALPPEQYQNWVSQQRERPADPEAIMDIVALYRPTRAAGEEEMATEAEGEATAAPAAAAATATATAAPATPEERALVVLNRKGCLSCHVINGVSTPQQITAWRTNNNRGPNLTFYGNRTTIAANTLPYSTENLAKWLANPGQVKPGNKMALQVKPGYLTPQEIQDLVTYLDGMKVSIEMPPQR